MQPARNRDNPLGCGAFLVFVLVYTPCMAAVAMMRRELESAKWTAFAVFYQITGAWLAAFAVYNIIGLFTGDTSVTFVYYLIAAAVVIYSGFMLARHFRRRGCCEKCGRNCESCGYAAGCSQKRPQKGADK